MRKITDNQLTEEILNQLPLSEFISLGGDVEKLKRQLNEYYQYNGKCHARTNRGDYSLLIEVVENSIYIERFIK